MKPKPLMTNVLEVGNVMNDYGSEPARMDAKPNPNAYPLWFIFVIFVISLVSINNV